MCLYVIVDILVQFLEFERYFDDDEEKEFFYRFVYNNVLWDVEGFLLIVGYLVLMLEVEVVLIQDIIVYQLEDQFGFLDLFIFVFFYYIDVKFEVKLLKILYDYLDFLFYLDVFVVVEDLD